MTMYLLCTYATESLPQHIRIVVVVFTQHFFHATTCPTQDGLVTNPQAQSRNSPGGRVQWTPRVDPGPVWRTVVWPRHGTCVAYRVVNRIISFSCVLLGPWLFCGGCGLYILSVYEIKLYLMQLKYTIWRKCTNSAEMKSIRIAMPAVSGMLWWSHSDQVFKSLCMYVSWKRCPNSVTEKWGKAV